MAIDGLGSKAVGELHLGNQALVSDLNGLGLQVNKDNILNVHKLLRGELERLQEGMNQASFKLVMGECGTDPVSPEAAQGFTNKMTQLRVHCNSYVKILDNAVQALHTSALSYGYAEDQIKASFSSISTDQLPSPTQPGAPESNRPITIDPSRTPRIPGLKIDLGQS